MFSWNGSQFAVDILNQPVNPCGLVALSYFNDTYLMFQGTENIPINENGIAWATDKEKKFKRGPNSEFT